MTIRVQKLYQITCDGSDPAGPNPEDADWCGNTLAPFHRPGGTDPVWHSVEQVREHADRWGWQHVPKLRFQARMFARPNEPRYSSDYEPFPDGEWYCPRHRPDKDKP